MPSNREKSETILHDLCAAYDGELRDAGVMMSAFGSWKREAERGEVAWSIASATAMLEEDILIARRRDDHRGAAIIREWVTRLRRFEEQPGMTP